MKGTFFSADFVKDSNGDLRLLELNTDTSVYEDKISDIDLVEFISILQTNSIDTLDIIYKPFIHKGIVEHIKSTIESDATFITTINLHDEDRNTIYPSAVTDADNKFILRLAYDEGAILDSTYAKNRLNVFKLFESGSASDKVVPFYHSGSDGIVNTLTNTINPSNIPDATVKDVDESFNPIDFHKLGSEVDGESDADKWAGFANAIKAEDKLIEQFCYHSSSLTGGNKLISTRVVSIVYGSNLDVTNVLSYSSPAVFALPTSLDTEINTGSYTNKLSDSHYYEYTTSIPNKGSAGILSTHKVLLHPTGAAVIDDIEVGDKVKSYFISGSPNDSSNLESIEWNVSGSSFPSGSYITSSDVVYVEKDDLKYGLMVELKVDNDSVFSGVNKQYLIYESSSDSTKYKVAGQIDHTTDYFFDADENIVDIDESNIYVTSDTGLKFVELDVEDTDTYLISGSTSFQSIVSHNAPCFIAGTKIAVGEGSDQLVNIEDVKIGDKVLSFNFKTNSPELQEVNATGVKKVSKTVTYTFEGGDTLEATLDHPLYCKHHGWVSNNPDYTSEIYNLQTTLISTDCEIQKSDGTFAKVTGIDINEKDTVVYNLRSVSNNHNFYANSFLAHNRFCFIAGTEITLGDGDVKHIEDIVAGEKVLTFNDESKENVVESVGDVKSRTVDSTLTLSFDSVSITCTAEHPFYVNGKYINAADLKVGDVCKTVEGETTLKSVEVNDSSVEVFNLHSVGDNHNFYANGILVHNKL